MNRVIILGLDAATFDLIEPWVDDGRLPNFARLMNCAARGRLQSTIPPITAVAWNSFATGKNPGKHGVFDFVRYLPTDHSTQIVNGGSRRALPFWRYLDHYGISVGVLNVPMTYPPEQLVHGFMVSGFDAPGLESDFVYPPELKRDLLKRGYVISPLAKTPAAWRRSLFQAFEVQKQVFCAIMRARAWDVLMMVFMQLDAAQHLFWAEMERQDSEFGDVIYDLYVMADRFLGELLTDLPDDTTLIIASDHGAGPLRASVSINNWLIKQGYLVLKPQNLPMRSLRDLLVSASTSLKQVLPSSVKTFLKRHLSLQDRAETLLWSSQIDWQQTKAFSLGEYGGIFINLRTGDETGGVSENAYETECVAISERLMRLRHPVEGTPIFRRIYLKENLYKGPYTAEAPDLIPDWNYRYECRSRIENLENDGAIFFATGTYIPFTMTVKTGSHRPEGVFLIYGPSIEPGDIGTPRLIDVFPTLMHLLGIPVPDDVDGRVLEEVFRDGWLEQHPVTYEESLGTNSQQRTTYTGDEESEFVTRLKGLGYLE